MSERTKLKKGLKQLGVDGDKLFEELAEAAAQRLPAREQPAFDMEAVVVAVEERIASKLDTIKALLESTDPKKTIQGVADLLKPEIVGIVEAVLTRQKQALLTEVSDRLAAARETGQNEGEQWDPSQDGQRRGGLTVVQLIDHILARSDKIAPLVELFKGKKSDNQAMALQTLKYFRFSETWNKMREGKLNADEAYKELLTLDAPPGQSGSPKS